ASRGSAGCTTYARRSRSLECSNDCVRDLTGFRTARKPQRSMQRRRPLLAAAFVLVLAGVAGAAPAPKPVAPPPPDNKETEAFLRQMGDAQKWMGEEVWKIKDKVEALP